MAVSARKSVGGVVRVQRTGPPAPWRLPRFLELAFGLAHGRSGHPPHRLAGHRHRRLRPLRRARGAAGTDGTRCHAIMFRTRSSIDRRSCSRMRVRSTSRLYGALVDCTQCAHCKRIISLICRNCGTRSIEQFHDICLYPVENIQTNNMPKNQAGNYFPIATLA